MALVREESGFQTRRRDIRQLERSDIRVLAPCVPIRLTNTRRVRGMVMRGATDKRAVLVPTSSMLIGFKFMSSLNPVGR